jgi:hypothetical protein
MISRILLLSFSSGESPLTKYRCNLLTSRLQHTRTRQPIAYADISFNDTPHGNDHDVDSLGLSLHQTRATHVRTQIPIAPSLETLSPYQVFTPNRKLYLPRPISLNEPVR